MQRGLLSPTIWKRRSAASRASYPDDGQRSAAYPATGFLGTTPGSRQTFSHFGEFVSLDYYPRERSGSNIRGLQERQAYGEHQRQARLRSLEPYTHPAILVPLLTPDVYRAGSFQRGIEELRAERRDAELDYLTLPVTTRQAPILTIRRRGPRWPETTWHSDESFEAVQSQQVLARHLHLRRRGRSQDGFDHVDAHRTVALAISPYTKRKFVDHTNYNQTGMVKDYRLILGLPPMNQLDLSATGHANCFQDVADLTPYTCLPNQNGARRIKSARSKAQGKPCTGREIAGLNLHEGESRRRGT